MLTTNDSDFNLYLTDVTADNLAVDADGRVHLVDVEDVVIVDRQQLEKGEYGDCETRGSWFGTRFWVCEGQGEF